MQNTLRPEANKRLSKLTLFAYGVGDFASNLCWTFIGSYLTVFYTDVVGLAPAVAAAIMLIARIWDGINDPMFGAIAERTNTKKGRFRPYIFYGAPFLALFSVLAFTTIGSGTTAVLWAAFTYIGCGMLYTVVNLSYGSLSTVMTTNPEDIAQLNSFRMMGTNLSSVLLNAITPPLLLMISGTDTYTARSYTIMAIIFAICALAPVLLRLRQLQGDRPPRQPRACSPEQEHQSGAGQRPPDADLPHPAAGHDRLLRPHGRGAVLPAV